MNINNVIFQFNSIKKIEIIALVSNSSKALKFFSQYQSVPIMQMLMT